MAWSKYDCRGLLMVRLLILMILIGLDVYLLAFVIIRIG